MTARLRGAAATAVVAALVAGCGASSTPADDVPRLADQLDAVDRALVDEDYARAGDRLRALVATAQQARTEGTLEDGEADRVLATAGQLLAALPTPAAEPAPDEAVPEEDGGQGGGVEVAPPAEPDEQAQEEERTAEEERKEREEERKERDEERKEDQEERKEDQEGGGNGDSSENGADDGEGN